MEHINRVLDLSLKFAEIENGNKDKVSLIALLHDVDNISGMTPPTIRA